MQQVAKQKMKSQTTPETTMTDDDNCTCCLFSCRPYFGHSEGLHSTTDQSVPQSPNRFGSRFLTEKCGRKNVRGQSADIFSDPFPRPENESEKEVSIRRNEEPQLIRPVLRPARIAALRIKKGGLLHLLANSSWPCTSILDFSRWQQDCLPNVKLHQKCFSTPNMSTANVTQHDLKLCRCSTLPR